MRLSDMAAAGLQTNAAAAASAAAAKTRSKFARGAALPCRAARQRLPPCCADTQTRRLQVFAIVLKFGL
jgi:hypothetical protein